MNSVVLLGFVVVFSAGFVIGYIAGEERQRIELKPCPVYPMERIASQSMVDNTTICTYVKTYGKAKRSEKL